MEDAMDVGEEDKPEFELQEYGIMCKAQKGDKVAIGTKGTGVLVPGGKRTMVAKRIGERAEAAARRKINELAEQVASAINSSMPDADSGGRGEANSGRADDAASSEIGAPTGESPTLELPGTQNNDCEYEGPEQDEMDALRCDLFAEIGVVGAAAAAAAAVANEVGAETAATPTSRKNGLA